MPKFKWVQSGYITYTYEFEAADADEADELIRNGDVPVKDIVDDVEIYHDEIVES